MAAKATLKDAFASTLTFVKKILEEESGAITCPRVVNNNF